MILDSTTRKLQVVLGEAHITNALAVVTSYFDSGATPSGGPSLSNTNGTTAVDIVAAPASGYIRQVNELTVFNADTVTHNVTVRYNDNGTTYTIFKASLAPGYTLTYSKALNWNVLSATGAFIAGQIPGTTTNDNAAAGMIGEYVSSTVLAGASVSVTSNTATDITSISLTPGDWDAWGYVESNPNASTVLTVFQGWISTVSAALPTRPNNGSMVLQQATYTTGANQGFPVGLIRLSLNTTSTVYLSCRLAFSASTMTAFGFIGARRVR